MTQGIRTSKLIFFTLACGLSHAHFAFAQVTQKQPITDSSAQASPVGPALNTPPTDDSAQASPLSPNRRGGSSIPAHTPLRVTLNHGIDSGHLKNGQIVQARLAVDVPLGIGVDGSRKRAVLPAGTPAVLTVVGTVPAGKINAVGEVSLQLVHVGNTAVDTDILTFRGQPGHRDLPDSAPEVGTNAGLPAGSALTFHVQPPPVFGGRTSTNRKSTPGSVTAVVSGSKAHANAGQGADRDPNQANGVASGTGNIPSGNAPAQPAQNTNSPQPAQNLGQPSVAPNQPASPASSTGTAQPH